MSEKPPWLDDQAELMALIGGFLDKLDRTPAEQWKQPPSIPLEAGSFPELFRLDEASDRTWQLFKLLEQQGIWEIRRKRRKNPFDAEFSGARIHLSLQAESELRDWLDRPRQESYVLQWQQAVDRAVQYFPGDPASLRQRPVKIPGHSADELVAAFVAIGDFAVRGLTLRQLSTRCFWGDSKQLENREELLRALYPDLRIAPRRLLVNVYLPQRIREVLFIENLDSYLDAVEQSNLTDAAGLVLVYSAGFRGSAERVRSRWEVCLHYTGDISSESRRRLEDWWFTEAVRDLPCHFWGDLDFAGITILKALRSRFPAMEAWQPGYAPMLRRLAQGHRADASGKQEQMDPGFSGCTYADEHLLPALRQQGRFLDQERIGWRTCLQADKSSVEPIEPE